MSCIPVHPFGTFQLLFPGTISPFKSIGLCPRSTLSLLELKQQNFLSVILSVKCLPETLKTTACPIKDFPFIEFILSVYASLNDLNG